MIEDDKGYLEDIIQAIDDIEAFVGIMSYDEFQSNRMCQHAIIRNLAVIGEATKRLSRLFIDQNNSVPWSLMARMRDRLVHDYGGIRIDILWTTVKSELPSLKNNIQNLVV